MAFLIKSSLTLLFLCLAFEGYDGCSLDNINIGTVRSGRELKGVPEWNVTVYNNCECSQSQIKLSCKGFKSAEEIDPSMLLVQGDTCLLINGNPLKASGSVSFSYVWDPPFMLLPVNTTSSGC